MPMDSREIHKRIKELGIMRKKTGQDKVSLLEVALFVEDEFGLTLSDAEICEENLGTNQDTETFVLRKLVT